MGAVGVKDQLKHHEAKSTQTCNKEKLTIDKKVIETTMFYIHKCLSHYRCHCRQGEYLECRQRRTEEQIRLHVHYDCSLEKITISVTFWIYKQTFY